MNAPSQTYSSIARLLHWAVAGLIVLQYVLARLAENAEHADRTVRVLALLANHKSVGITILMLAVVRLVWRFYRRPPPLPASMSAWQVGASRVSHGLLYLLLFALPLSGWLMSSATAYSVSWFGLFQLPDLLGPDPELSDRLEQIHEVLAKTLFVVALLHILGAFKHVLFDRDGVMSRMTSAPVVAVFLALIGGGVYLFAIPASRQSAAVNVPAADARAPQELPQRALAGDPASELAAETAASEAKPAEFKFAEPPSAEESLAQAAPVDAPPGDAAPAKTQPAEAPKEPLAPSDEALPVWQIDFASSFIRFTGDQAGASFTGEWTSWDANIQFAAEALDRSAFAVTVNTENVDTRDADRDATIVDPDWFDSANHPQAFYNASRFSAAGDGSFVADGQLTIKGVQSPVELTFTVTGDQSTQVISGQGRLLEGNALLDRLALGLGLGDWQDTSWVGRDVQVEVRVEATLP